MVTALYKRVSTAKQEEFGASLETQQEKLEAYCTIKDFGDVKEYVDVGTGRNTDRIDFQRMMRDIENGLITNVVVLRLDRLTRSVSDLDKLVKKFKKHGCELHSATESLDTSTANGRMMVNIIATFAQWESETISERVTINMDSLSEKGIWMSSVPFGFDLGADKRLKINQKEAAILREAFRLIQEGNSFTATEKMMIEKHDLDWSYNYLTRKVRHATTVGDIMRKGKITEDTHEGIISKDEQAKLLEILKVNSTGRRFIDQDDIFRRRVVCYSCQNVMSLTARSTNNYKTINYNYVCDNCHKRRKGFISVAELAIEKAFLAYLNNLMLEDVSDSEEEPEDDTALVVSDLKKRLKALDSKRDRIQRAWIANSMSEEDLMKYKKEIDDETLTVEDELSKLSVKKVVVSNAEIREVVEYFSEHFNKLDRAEKRTFIQQHVKSISFNRELVEGFKKKYTVWVTNVEFF